MNHPLRRLLFQASVAVGCIGIVSGCQAPPVRWSIQPRLEQVWKLDFPAPEGVVTSMTYPTGQSGEVFLIQTPPGGAPRYLKMRTYDGKVLWEKQFEPTGEVPYYNMGVVLHDDYVAIPASDRLRILRWDSGAPYRDFQPVGGAMPFLEHGDDGAIWQASNAWNKRASAIWRYDVENSDMREVFSMPWPDSMQLLLATPTLLANGHLFFTVIERNTVNQYTTSKWFVFDPAQKQILRKGAAYPPNQWGYGPGKPALLYRDKVIFIAFNRLVCIDPVVGHALWEREFPRDMLSSYPMIYANRLFLAMEDQQLYCIDPSNGQVIWHSTLSGTPGRMVAGGNQLFVVGGGDGLLYTFDISDGRILRKMAAPNHHYLPNAFFQRPLALDTLSGRLMLFDGQHLRGYDVWEKE